MTARELNKTKLSKSILEMKFMKKTKEKVIQEQEDEEGRNMYSNEITDKMRQNKGPQYVIETSFAICENLLEGRLSYKGMNPEIERLLELEELAKAAQNNSKTEADISDQEMSKHYGGRHRRNAYHNTDNHSKYNPHPNKRKSNNDHSKTPLKFIKPNV